jgi:basic membrane protein A and related proteins
VATKSTAAKNLGGTIGPIAASVIVTWRLCHLQFIDGGQAQPYLAVTSATYQPTLQGENMRSSQRVLAVAATFGLLLAACGSDTKEAAGGDTSAAAPADSAAAPADSAAPAEGGEFKACEVTDTGGIDDKGFNQIAYAGLQQAEAELGAKIANLESASDADYAPNIQAMIDQKCNVIITVGFLLDGASVEAAKANPEQQFGIVDSGGMDNNGTPDDFADDKAIANLRSILFSVGEPSFVAGYIAAGMTKTGKVGTYGGINIPPVVAFMDGFLKGVNHYNEVKGTKVEVLGWDGKDGAFAGNFQNLDDGKKIAQSQVDAGADIVFPVAGPVGLGSSALALELGPEKLSIIGVDLDMYESNDKEKSVYLTSVLKNIDVAVFDTIKGVADTGKVSEGYMGTFANGGVGIAPFHDFDAKVPAELKTEVETLIADLTSGKMKIG